MSGWKWGAGFRCSAAPHTCEYCHRACRKGPGLEALLSLWRRGKDILSFRTLLQASQVPARSFALKLT